MYHSRLDRHEEADGEGLVLVGQGDHHELAARPDVQVIRRHRELQRTNEEGVKRKRPLQEEEDVYSGLDATVSVFSILTSRNI